MINSQGKLYAFLDNGTVNIDVTGTRIITDGEWHHVAAVYDRDGYLVIYIDGLWESEVLISLLISLVANFPALALMNFLNTA